MSPWRGGELNRGYSMWQKPLSGLRQHKQTKHVYCCGTDENETSPSQKVVWANDVPMTSETERDSERESHKIGIGVIPVNKTETAAGRQLKFLN